MGHHLWLIPYGLYNVDHIAIFPEFFVTIIKNFMTFLGSTLVCSTFIYCFGSNISYITANRYFCDSRKMERSGIALFW